MRTTRTFFATSSLVLLLAGCSASKTNHAAPTFTAPPSRPATTRTATPTTSHVASTPVASAASLTAPPPKAGSPAVARFGASKVTAALQLAAHLAYYGVADPTLLGHQSPHAGLADYARITQYLTATAVQDLRSYIADQTTDATHNSQAATLALSNLTRLPNRGTALTTGDHGLRLDKPFRVAGYTANINPTVTLGSDNTTMVVTGSCAVRIFGHRGAKPVYVTFRRTSFTFFVQPTPSRAYPVAVSGWKSISSIKITPR